MSLGSEATPSTAVLAITGMHCSSCAALIEETLALRDGVTSVTVDLTSELAQVTFDPSRVAVEDLCAAIVQEGYGAEPQSAPSS